MNYLFVVAHPDDEILGAGATLRKLADQGHHVAVAVMCAHAAARKDISPTLSEDEATAMALVGVERTFSADFPNIKMNTVPHLDLVQFIEKSIAEWQACAIVTHHPSDVNIDHRETSRAAQAAARLFQRTTSVPPLRFFAYMEVPSCTEWSLDPSSIRFQPNLFVEIGPASVDLKIRALSAYAGVMRPYPHPRSPEAIRGLAAYRGAQAGCNCAEAFQTAFSRL